MADAAATRMDWRDRPRLDHMNLRCATDGTGQTYVEVPRGHPALRVIAAHGWAGSSYIMRNGTALVPVERWDAVALCQRHEKDCSGEFVNHMIVEGFAKLGSSAPSLKEIAYEMRFDPKTMRYAVAIYHTRVGVGDSAAQAAAFTYTALKNCGHDHDNAGAYARAAQRHGR